MIKYLFLLIFSIYCAKSNAQTVTITGDGNAIDVTNVIKTDTLLKKNNLYSLGTEWFVNVFNNPKLVMQMQDSDAGIIIGKCSLSIIDTMKLSFLAPTTYPVTEIDFLIKLSFKDAKMKYEIYGFVTKGGNIIKTGHVTVGEFPDIAMVNKKKLREYYEHSYINAQIASIRECATISQSLEDFFTKHQLKNDW